MFFPSKLRLLSIGLLAPVVLAACGDGDSAQCAALGCEPEVQVADGTTYIEQTVTGNPPFPDPSGFPGAVSINQQPLGGQVTKIQYVVTNPTTFAVPRQTPAPGSTYGIATSYVTYGNLVYETPYLTAQATPTIPPVTSTEYVTLPKETTTETTTLPAITVVSTTTSTLPPVTSTSTTTTTQWSTSTLPAQTITTTETFTPVPVTSVSTSTFTWTYTTTSTSTTTLPPVTSTTTTSVSYCPTAPPKPCQHRVFTSPEWDYVSLGKSPNGALQPESLPGFPYDVDTRLTLTDADYREEKFSVTIDGRLIGWTSDFQKDKTFCSSGGNSGQACINLNFSNGQFTIPAGSRNIVIGGSAPGSTPPTLPYTAAFYKVEEICAS